MTADTERTVEMFKVSPNFLFVMLLALVMVGCQSETSYQMLVEVKIKNGVSGELKDEIGLLRGTWVSNDVEILSVRKIDEVTFDFGVGYKCDSSKSESIANEAGRQKLVEYLQSHMGVEVVD